MKSVVIETEGDIGMALRNNYSSVFERFWSAYPAQGRVSKGTAYRAFQKLKFTDEEANELVLYLEGRKKNDQKWVEGKYIPHATSFLNGHRWLDDYPRARREGGRSTPGVLTVSDEDNKRAWALDQQKRGQPVPDSYQHYLVSH